MQIMLSNKIVHLGNDLGEVFDYYTYIFFYFAQTSDLFKLSWPMYPTLKSSKIFAANLHTIGYNL